MKQTESTMHHYLTQLIADTGRKSLQRGFDNFGEISCFPIPPFSLFLLFVEL
jgi:hypothetical protein